jgi:hypothetical protein
MEGLAARETRTLSAASTFFITDAHVGEIVS